MVTLMIRFCVSDKDEINDPIEWSFRVKFVTNECSRGLSFCVSDGYFCFMVCVCVLF